MDINNTLEQAQLSAKIYAQLNNFIDLKNSLQTIVGMLREHIKAEAISIRLFDEGDYPFFVSDGFSEAFLNHENSIINARDQKQTYQEGKVFKLDCLCGRVIRGDIDPIKSYHTKSGSFITNDSNNEVVSIINSEDGKNIRNYCGNCGYESIGLFPIKVRDENIGLLQLNDKRVNFFSKELIGFLEKIGEQIGVAVENAMIFEKLKHKNTELENTVTRLNNMQEQLIEAKKTSMLADMVASMTHEMYDPLSQALTASAASLEIAYNLAEKDTGYADEINTLSLESKKSLKNIEEVRDLIRSFKAIAIDQFQESRQLINLKEFIENVIKVIKPSLTEVNIDFKVKVKKRIEIMSYSGALSQILTQLINNSYLHGFKNNLNGEITIECKIGPSDTILINYSDNGSGLEANTSHKIFEPFFTTNRKLYPGLGLTIAENLITNKLKGNIDVITSNDDGVEFAIQFPY